MFTPEDKIKNCIDAYKKVFESEYKTFLSDTAKLKIQQNKHGLLKDTQGMGEWRRLTEIPITLNNIIMSQSTPEEWQWYNSQEGKIWIAKTFPEFRAREVV